MLREIRDIWQVTDGKVGPIGRIRALEEVISGIFAIAIGEDFDVDGATIEEDRRYRRDAFVAQIAAIHGVVLESSEKPQLTAST